MRLSAIRFGADLWRLLEAEAARVDVSVSQYVREAALMRATATITARGEDPAAALAGAAAPAAPEPSPSRTRAKRARESARDTRSGAQAVIAETQQLERRYGLRRAGDRPRQDTPPGSP